ncbi:MAG TPA: plastocyanin/azurin family copper-binding protein [Candidatus Acidoferrum sp.]|nr:plastocyanin/azurin family copper-binding protein [Candidatus Acidoferrum sp.]
MKSTKWASLSAVVSFALLAVLSASQATRAQQNWNATVGAQNKDMSRQVAAFLPNEMWIHAGDQITWTFATGDIHTVTFLTVGQIYPADFTTGCPGFSTSPATFDGTTCVTSQATSTPSPTPPIFTVIFPTPGNYEVICMVHPEMFGVIHVLGASEILPYDQAFYDGQAGDESRTLLGDLDHPPLPQGHHHSTNGALTPTVISHTKPVTAGYGEITATPGGQEALSVVRFIDGTVQIHAGDTVEWTNWDPIIGHTITFGTEPADLFDPSCSPSCSVTLDSDGALHATITGSGQNLHSGFIFAALEGYTGPTPVPLAPLFPPTRFRATFTEPGVYNYKCSLHDNLGMVGTVVVLP